MEEELTYKRLRDLAREEKMQAGLMNLNAGFYLQIESFLSSKFSQVEKTRQVLQIKEFENSLSLIKEIISLRQQKILFRAIRSGGEEKKNPDMTCEEQELYGRFCALIFDENEKINSIISKYSAKPAIEKEKSQATKEIGLPEKGNENLRKKVRFLKDVPAYIGINKETIGPFKPGDEGILPEKEADLLLKEKLVKEAE